MKRAFDSVRAWCRGPRMAIVAVLVGVALGYAAHVVRAEGIPTAPTLYYSGVLEENGVAANGIRSMKLRLYDALDSNATLVCESTPTSAGGNAGDVTVTSGRFRFVVDDTCVAAINQNPNLYAELVVGTETFTRAKIGAVPYAIQADHAVTATNASHATSADNATSATNATNATNATTATTATTATNATHASTADGAQQDFSVPGTLHVGYSISTSCTTDATYHYTDCACPTGSIAVGGGGYGALDGSVTINESRSGSMDGFPGRWRLGCWNGSARVKCAYSHAVCLRVAN